MAYVISDSCIFAAPARLNARLVQYRPAICSTSSILIPALTAVPVRLLVRPARYQPAESVNNRTREGSGFLFLFTEKGKMCISVKTYGGLEYEPKSKQRLLVTKRSSV